MLKVDINIKDAAPKVAEAAALLKDGRPIFERISQALESVVEANFEAQRWPGWLPLAKSTVAARTKGKGGSLLKILQDTGTLASSISTEYGPDYALIGAGVHHYAAVHQFGATIERPAYSTKVRLRTDAKDNLVPRAPTCHSPAVGRRYNPARSSPVHPRRNDPVARPDLRPTFISASTLQSGRR